MRGHNYGLCKKCGKTHIHPFKGKRRWGDQAQNPFKGKHHSIATRLRLRELRLGKKRSEETRRKISFATKGEKNPRAKWLKLSDLEIRNLWEKYKKSGLGLVMFSRGLHAGPEQIRKLFKKNFPEEWTKLVKRNLLHRQKDGWDFQRDVADLYEFEGYTCFWVSGLRIGDIIALKLNEIPILIECTLARQRSTRRQKVKALLPIATRAGVKAVLAISDDGYKITRQLLN